MKTKQLSLAVLVADLMEQRSIDRTELAARCKVTPQTVKNVLDGKSVNARFLITLIELFRVDHDEDLLRRFLLAFLALQFPDRRAEVYLRKAGLAA